MCRTSAAAPIDSARPCEGAPRSHNYDARGRRLNPQGGYYLIPADQFQNVVARAQWDKRILNCFPFVPLPGPGANPAPACPCPTAPAPLRRTTQAQVVRPYAEGPHIARRR